MSLNKNTTYSFKKLIFSFIALLILSLILIISTGRAEVKIVKGDSIINYEFKGKQTVGEILEANEIELREEDSVSPSLDEVIEDGDEIVIEEAVTVTVKVDGKKYEFLTSERNVDTILDKLNIETSDLDIVEPSLASRIDEEDREIQVVRVEEEFETNTTPIKYKNIVEKNDEMDLGESVIVQKGSNGIKEIKEKVIYHDGEEYERVVVEENVVKEPVDEIKEVGTNNLIATSRGTVKFVKKIKVTATGYCSSTGYGDGSTTASGTTPKEGRTIAASGSYSFGTNIYIPAMNNTYVVEDRGGAITGNKIDIYFSSYEEAKAFGRRTFYAYVLE